MKRFICLVVSVSLLIINSSYYSFSQNKDFIYQNNPNLQNDVIKSDRKTYPINVFNNAIDLTKYLPIDFIKDASIDYTEYIQKGLDENRIVKMPNFSILVSEKGINVKSGSRIIFQCRLVKKTF